jgi:hypothetical protein
MFVSLSMSFLSGTLSISSALCSCCSLDGIEVRLINALASKMNFTAVFALPTDGYNWGFVFDNGTINGMIGTPQM